MTVHYSEFDSGSANHTLQLGLLQQDHVSRVYNLLQNVSLEVHQVQVYYIVHTLGPYVSAIYIFVRQETLEMINAKYAQVYRPSVGRAETCAGRVRCCPWRVSCEYAEVGQTEKCCPIVSHFECGLLRWDRQTDRQTPDRYQTQPA